MQFVNLTPHSVVVYGQDDQIVLEVPASGTIARLAEIPVPCGDIDGIPCITVTLPCATAMLGTVAGLPDPQDGVVYIGSMPLLMGMAAAGIRRPDVVYPYGQVRDAGGRIIGCRALANISA